MNLRACVSLVATGLVLPSCLGVQAGALHDYQQSRTEGIVSVFLEAYAPLGVFERDHNPSYGARATTMFPFRSPVNFSLQPQINLSLLEGKVGLTLEGSFFVGLLFAGSSSSSYH
jgi:hypothetical protein